MSETCSACAGTGQLHRQDCGAHGLTVGCGDCGGSGGWGKCSHCDNPVRLKHGILCASCIADEIDGYDYDEDANDCANCGGEGFTYGCSWDWQCDTWDGDSCLCTRRCEWCQPLKPDELAERAKLQQLLADALAQPKPTGGHNAD